MSAAKNCAGRPERRALEIAVKVFIFITGQSCSVSEFYGTSPQRFSLSAFQVFSVSEFYSNRFPGEQFRGGLLNRIDDDDWNDRLSGRGFEKFPPGPQNRLVEIFFHF